MLKEKDDQKAFNRDILTKFEQLQQKIMQPTPAANRASPGGCVHAVPPSIRRRTFAAGARSAAQAGFRPLPPAWWMRPLPC
jgi:hypothetical protein